MLEKETFFPQGLFLQKFQTSCYHIFASIVFVLEVGIHLFYVSSHLDSTEFVIVESCLYQDHP